MPLVGSKGKAPDWVPPDDHQEANTEANIYYVDDKKCSKRVLIR